MNSWGFFSRLKGPLLIFLLSLYLYFLAGKMEEVPIPGQLGPAFWPKAILILLMISCGIKALEFFFAEKRKKAPEQELSRPPVNLPKLAVMIVLVIAAVVALDALGFLLANFLFLLSFMRVAGLKKKIPLLLTSVLGTILLIYLFVKVVYLPLPRGRWFFDDVTIFLYRILRVF